MCVYPSDACVKLVGYIRNRRYLLGRYDFYTHSLQSVGTDATVG